MLTRTYTTFISNFSETNIKKWMEISKVLLKYSSKEVSDQLT